MILTNVKIEEEAEVKDQTGPDAIVYKFTTDRDRGHMGYRMAEKGAWLAATHFCVFNQSINSYFIYTICLQLVMPSISILVLF